MSIEQEKMIVEALPSLYPLQKFEEDAIHTVLDAIPHWIPVTERLPKSKEEDLEYPTVLITFENEEIMLGCFYESTKEWGTGEYFDQNATLSHGCPCPNLTRG